MSSRKCAIYLTRSHTRANKCILVVSDMSHVCHLPSATCHLQSTILNYNDLDIIKLI